jgi:hypothetical protein
MDSQLVLPRLQEIGVYMDVEQVSSFTPVIHIPQTEVSVVCADSRHRAS